MVRVPAIHPYITTIDTLTTDTKRKIMNTHINFEMPTQAEIEKMIYQAHRMRSEYLANSIKAGLSNLRGIFINKKALGKPTA
jgi:hypothetical protein